MKKLLLGFLGMCLCGFAAQAQNYAIDWFSIDGGGGTSTGGVYSVSGTIGQADAGHMSGGNFTLDGGFWAIIAAVQTPGAPTLRVVRGGTNTVVVAWAASSTFNLEQNPTTASGGWTAVTNTPIIVGSEKQVIISSPIGNKFYRLKSP